MWTSRYHSLAYVLPSLQMPQGRASIGHWEDCDGLWGANGTEFSEICDISYNAVDILVAVTQHGVKIHSRECRVAYERTHLQVIVDQYVPLANFDEVPVVLQNPQQGGLSNLLLFRYHYP